MTGRILRLELRRSAALWAGVAIAVFGAALLYLVVGTEATGWGGRWMLLGLWQREYLFVFWPLALGVGAWHAGRERRCRTAELISTTARSHPRRVLPSAAAMALSGVTGYTVMYGAGAAQVAATGSYLPPQAVAVAAVGVLWLVAGSWLGMALGALVPSRLVAPAVTVAGAVLPMVSAGGRAHPDGLPKIAHLLTPAPFGFWGDFVTVSGRVSLAHAGWLVGLAGTGLLLVLATTRTARAVAALPAVAGAAVALSLLPPGRQAMPQPDPAATALVCTTDSAAKVCVTRVHARMLVDLRQPAREALATLAVKLPDAPVSVEESVDDRAAAQRGPRRADTVLIDLEPDAWGRAKEDAEVLRWRLLDGAGTRPCRYLEDRPQAAADSHHIARLAAAAWLADRPPPAGEYRDQARHAWERLRAMPADEQRARVAAVRTASLTCTEVDLLDLLVGDGGDR